jgi:hypothetical protein
MDSSSLDIASKWANVAIAMIAFVSLALAYRSFRSSIKLSNEVIKTSENTVKTLAQISQTFKQAYDILEPFSKPLVRIDKYKWTTEAKEISSESLPHGIIIYFKNISLVPIEVFDSDLRVFYGLKKFDDITHKLGDGEINRNTILAPGESSSAFNQQPELFKKYLSARKSLYEEPTLIVELKVVFSKLNDTKKLTYHARQKIYVSFEPPAPTIRQTISEKYYEETTA